MSRRRRREREDEARAPSSELVRRLASDVAYRTKRRRKKQRTLLKRFLRAGLMMMFVTFVVIPSMIAGGFLLGPKGVEGLIAAPLLLFLSYAGILYWTFKRRPELPATFTALPAGSAIAQLPAQTDDWLEQQRSFLPYAAQTKLDSIGKRLEALAPQVEKLDPAQPVASELRRLLGEELPELVSGYRKVPSGLQQKPLHDGPSPERQLLEGLDTIDEQIGRMHERLAAEDLHALATHQRYLDLKYKRDDELK
jgi:hypothetical protein